MAWIVGPLHPESVRNQFSGSEPLPLSQEYSLEGRIGRNEKPIGDAGFRNCCANVRLGLGCLTLVHGSARTLGRRFLFLFLRSHHRGSGYRRFDTETGLGSLSGRHCWTVELSGALSEGGSVVSFGCPVLGGLLPCISRCGGTSWVHLRSPANLVSF